MDANRFFSVSYDVRNHPLVKKLRFRFGGISAFGRYMALLGLLYDEGATLDMDDDATRGLLETELELKGEKLDEFISALADYGFLDADALATFGKVHCPSVAEQLEYRRDQSGKRKGKTAEAAVVDTLVEAGLLDRKAWARFEEQRKGGESKGKRK